MTRVVRYPLFVSNEDVVDGMVPDGWTLTPVSDHSYLATPPGFKHSCRWCDERRRRSGIRRSCVLVLTAVAFLLGVGALTLHQPTNRAPSAPSTTYQVNLSLPNQPQKEGMQP